MTLTSNRVRDRQRRRTERGGVQGPPALGPADVHVESTSWKRPAVIAIASLGLVAGSLWLMTQDIETIESITTINGDETAAEPDPTPRPSATAIPSAGRTESPAGEPLDLDDFAREQDVSAPVARPVPATTPLPEGAIPIPTLIPALPQLQPNPRVPTIPTLIPSTPAPQAAVAAPPPHAAPAQAAPPRPSPFDQVAPAPAPAPPPTQYVAPTPQWQPAPVAAPAPAPIANGSACTQIAVAYDANLDGVADGSLPSPCSPCPSGAPPAHRNNDVLLDC